MNKDDFDNPRLPAATEDDEERGKGRLSIAVASLLAVMFLGSIWLGSYFSDRTAEIETKRSDALQDRIEHGVRVGTAPIIHLELFKQSSNILLTAVSESGEVVVIDEKFELLAQGETPLTADAAVELPHSVTRLVALSKTLLVGGTANGKLNLYKIADGKLVVEKELADFRNPGISDPLVAAGSITHLVLNPAKNILAAVNYDGAVRFYAVGTGAASNSFRQFAQIELTAGAVGGRFINDREIWLATHDGHLTVFDALNPQKPGREFDTSEFGRIRGADYRQGKFAVFGQSVEFKEAAVGIYSGADGRFEQILKVGGTGEEAAEAESSNKVFFPALPDASDLGDSFEDVVWLDDTHLVAVKNKQVLVLDTVQKKINSYELPLQLNESTTRVIVGSGHRSSQSGGGAGSLIIGTNQGRVFAWNIAV